jgi:hypothetical protein
MSAARRLARLAKKGNGGSAAASFQRVTEALAGIKQLGGTLEGMLPEAQASVQATKTALDQLGEQIREVGYLMERQKMVTLRMHPCLGGVVVESFEELLALQERYEAEYDAEHRVSPPQEEP